MHSTLQKRVKLWAICNAVILNTYSREKAISHPSDKSANYVEDTRLEVQKHTCGSHRCRPLLNSMFLPSPP